MILYINKWYTCIIDRLGAKILISLDVIGPKDIVIDILKKKLYIKNSISSFSAPILVTLDATYTCTIVIVKLKMIILVYSTLEI